MKKVCLPTRFKKTVNRTVLLAPAAGEANVSWPRGPPFFFFFKALLDSLSELGVLRALVAERRGDRNAAGSRTHPLEAWKSASRRPTPPPPFLLRGALAAAVWSSQGRHRLTAPPASSHSRLPPPVCHHCAAFAYPSDTPASFEEGKRAQF